MDVEGYSVEEAAALLDCPPGTIKSRCSRGRARLAVSLGFLRDSIDPDAKAEPVERNHHPPPSVGRDGGEFEPGLRQQGQARIRREVMAVADGNDRDAAGSPEEGIRPAGSDPAFDPDIQDAVRDTLRDWSASVDAEPFDTCARPRVGANHHGARCRGSHLGSD